MKPQEIRDRLKAMAEEVESMADVLDKGCLEDGPDVVERHWHSKAAANLEAARQVLNLAWIGVQVGFNIPEQSEESSNA